MKLQYKYRLQQNYRIKQNETGAYAEIYAEVHI